MKTYINFEQSSRINPYLSLSGILLILFGISIILVPEILVFMIAAPIIFLGIFLIVKWFNSNRKGNNSYWVEN